jgi:hypothetical protein
MFPARFLTLSAVVALCAAATAPLAAADSHRSLAGSHLASKRAILLLTSSTQAQSDQKAIRLGGKDTTLAGLHLGSHRRVMASAAGIRQLGNMDPHACGDPGQNCEPLSLMSVARRIAKYPEPAALSLFGTSLLGIAGVTRRRFLR